MKKIKSITRFLSLLIVLVLGISTNSVSIYASGTPTPTPTPTPPPSGVQQPDFIPYFNSANKGEEQYTIFDENPDTTQMESVGIDLEGVKSIREKTEGFVKIISGLIFGFSAITIVFAGFKYASSEGETRVTEQAKMQIIYAGIGIGISLMNLIIIQAFEEILRLG